MCDLTLYRDNNQGAVSVSNFFIDEFLADANDAQIKIYLYLLRMTGANCPTNISDIADKFNHTEKDVCRALRYWEKKGILSLDYDKNGGIVGIRLHEPSQIKPNSGSLMAVSAPVKASSEVFKPVYSLDELKAFKNRQETPQLIFIAESYLKKTLSANDVRSILFYTDELHFSVDLIDYLIQFCADRKKTSFAYMDRVAIDWAENGITTVKQAKQYTSQITGGSAPTSKIRDISARKTTTAFHQIDQNAYDFDKLEEQLLRQQ